MAIKRNFLLAYLLLIITGIYNRITFRRKSSKGWDNDNYSFIK